MRIGFTEKSANKIGMGTLPKLGASDFSLSDWSVHVFTLKRVPYFLAMNASTYLCSVFYGKGVNDLTSFTKALSYSLSELFEEYNQTLIYRNFIDPRSHGNYYFKSLSKSLIANMNRRIEEMKMSPKIEDLAPLEISLNLNTVPLQVLKYSTAQEQLGVVIKNGI